VFGLATLPLIIDERWSERNMVLIFEIKTFLS
jgi:hypothetical protein